MMSMERNYDQNTFNKITFHQKTILLHSSLNLFERVTLINQSSHLHCFVIYKMSALGNSLSAGPYDEHIIVSFNIVFLCRTCWLYLGYTQRMKSFLTEWIGIFKFLWRGMYVFTHDSIIALFLLFACAIPNDTRSFPWKVFHCQEGK